MIDKEKLDQLIQDISAPLFIYRMSKPVAEPSETGPDEVGYDDRLTKGARTKVNNARQEIHEMVLDYVRDVERGEMNG